MTLSSALRGKLGGPLVAVEVKDSKHGASHRWSLQKLRYHIILYPILTIPTSSPFPHPHHPHTLTPSLSPHPHHPYTLTILTPSPSPHPHHPHTLTIPTPSPSPHPHHPHTLTIPTPSPSPHPHHSHTLTIPTPSPSPHPYHSRTSTILTPSPSPHLHHLQAKASGYEKCLPDSMWFRGTHSQLLPQPTGGRPIL